ncbi:peptidase M23 family protein [Collimonas arenae]|uniref:Peptidase M23 family protein n=1 Tax=Collimonas arenae TaxID=279058 RepID=A0A127PX35_9BURK|nr:peptidoglycan DD-metalloendopeptidase family protein [Collimonas arenae]AMP01932.1 peptidase M23 family protein [Collimonas arenae]AMP11831.1 peptidase M23 family protein [Collimonas arenae]
MLPLPAQAAPKATERSKQKQAAEAQRADLREKLDVLKRDISQTETEKDNASDALADSESAISKANRSLRDLSTEQSQTQAKLAQLAKKHDELSKTVTTQQTQLANLLRQQYLAGNEDRIKLLLSGDNPNRINRDLQYMGYVSQAQAKLLESLRANLAAVEANQTETQNAKDDLDEIAQEQRDQKTLLEKEKSKRAALLTQLSGKLASQRKEVGNIQRDDQRLSGLVDRLDQLIEAQKKADAAAREKLRQQQLAQAQAQAQAKAQAARERQKALEQQRAAALARKTPPASDTRDKPKTVNPDAIDDDQPPPTAAVTKPVPAPPVVETAPTATDRNELTPLPDAKDGAYGRPFESLRGQLRLPVRGDLMARFGSKRGDGPTWKGLFIRTAEGAEVKAVAAGRVVFADWLRGFGNLIIVDHGNQYMTIYGNNQALLKRPGDAVKTGDVIASAGNSGGNEQSGLYFEIRHQGRAFDPLGWVTTR